MNNSKNSMFSAKTSQPSRRERIDRFLFSEASEGQARFSVLGKENSQLLGEKTGRLVLASWKDSNAPVKGVMTFGRERNGKSTFCNAVFSQFENASEFSRQPKVKFERFESTYPKCLHIDYHQYNSIYRYAYDSNKPKEDEFVFAEWTEFLPEDSLPADCIEVEFLRCAELEDFSKKFSEMKHPFSGRMPRPLQERSYRLLAATFIGKGRGIAVVEALKADDALKALLV